MDDIGDLGDRGCRGDKGGGGEDAACSNCVGCGSALWVKRRGEGEIGSSKLRTGGTDRLEEEVAPTPAPGPAAELCFCRAGSGATSSMLLIGREGLEWRALEWDCWERLMRPSRISMISRRSSSSADSSDIFLGGIV